MVLTLRPRVRASGRWPKRRENNRPRAGAEQYIGGMMADGTGTLERVSIDWQHPEPVRKPAPTDRASAKSAVPEAWLVAPASPELPTPVVSPVPVLPNRRVSFLERLRR